MQHIMWERVNSTMSMHVSDNSKTQNMCDKAVTFKKLLFTIINVPDQHKTQPTCKKVILKKPGMLQFIPNHCTTQRYVKKQLIIILIH